MADLVSANFIWSIAEVLRGNYRRSDNGKVILPFAVLRRLDSTLEPTKNNVLETLKKAPSDKIARDFLLQKASGYPFYNTSKFDLKSVLGDPANLKANLIDYIEGFSSNVRDIFERYEIRQQIDKLEELDLLLLILQKFVVIDLHPKQVSNVVMGQIFEDLIGKAMEASNEEAGEYFTPRDVVRLIVNLLFSTDDEILSKPGVIRSVYDPTAGTGGMLSVAEDYLRHLNPDARLTLFGQELNEESYAIAKADMLIKGQDVANIVWGDTLTGDGHFGKTFDYCLANPPFGVKWERQHDFVKNEHKQLGYDGRFGPGLPKITDGALLFVMHLISKMRPVSDGGSRIGVVLSASAFYNGDAGSGYSEIRKYLLESDLVEAIVGLPDSLFYNTGIPTYIWILDNAKRDERKGKVQLIDASSQFERLRKAVGEKRKEISNENLMNVLKSYEDFEMSRSSKIYSKDDFTYEQVTFDLPRRVSCVVNEDFLIQFEVSKDAHKYAGDQIQTLTKKIREEFINDSKIERQEFRLRFTSCLEIMNKKITPALLEKLISIFYIDDSSAEILRDSKGRLIPDIYGRFTEKGQIDTDWSKFLSEDIHKFLPDAELVESSTAVGCEILWARVFGKPTDPEPAPALQERIDELTKQLLENFKGGKRD
jgi:type I restriction enzyme M protein